MLCTSSNSWSADPIYTGIFSGVAIKGYDTVSYFQDDGKPQKGDKQFKTTWQGATWYFVSSQNLDLFKEDPVAYAPQYGGYCAWAAAQDKLAKGDPLVYHKYEGKLYLNYNEGINENWLSRKAEFIRKANIRYPQLVDF